MSAWLLSALVLLPLAGGIVAALVDRGRAGAPRLVALATALTVFGLTLWLCLTLDVTGGGVLVEQRLEWIPSFGIDYHLALDGLSLVFVALTALVGLIAVLASWREIEERTGLHYLCLLATLAGIMGVFLAWDLFLFYFFWELMLVPMYFLIGVWGHERRVPAAIKFVLFTMISGLLLLVAIVVLYFHHGASTGVYTMGYAELVGTPIPPQTARWLFLGFVAAFAVKLPLFPLHSWLPDAHTEAPTAGSILLAGLLLKTGGYGLVRFAWPLFPDAAAGLSAPLALLGVVGIVYGAVAAFAQRDLKRLIAYTSVSHMGFVVLGISLWQRAALEGAVVQMVAHGIATSALFALAGMLYERTHTKLFAELGGIWARLPRLSAFTVLFVLAGVGLPGFGNFVGEFTVLLTGFALRPTMVVVATAGIVLGTVAMLALVQRAFFGTPSGRAVDLGGSGDLGARELVMLSALAVASVAIGMAPGIALDRAAPTLARLMAIEVPFDPADPEIDVDRQIVADGGRQAPVLDPVARGRR